VRSEPLPRRHPNPDAHANRDFYADTVCHLLAYANTHADIDANPDSYALSRRRWTLESQDSDIPRGRRASR
jgi:hypothetical protein